MKPWRPKVGPYPWQNRGPVLSCPYCKHHLIHEQVGPCRLRAPTARELVEAGIAQPGTKRLSRTRTREEAEVRGDDEVS